MSGPADERDRELLEHLHRSGGADIQSLCDVLGVTRTAVRHRIQRLEAEGAVESSLQSAGRGRPRALYSVTAEGLHLLGENYRDLAVALWEAVSELEDDQLRARIMAGVRDRLVGQFSSSIRATDVPRRRMATLVSNMRASGFNIESDESGELPILRETSCPFPLLAEVDESICQVEREVLQQVLGMPVEVVNRCRDGHSCCEFAIGGPGEDLKTSEESSGH